MHIVAFCINYLLRNSTDMPVHSARIYISLLSMHLKIWKSYLPTFLHGTGIA